MDKKTEKLLRRIGYTKLKKKHGEVVVTHKFPDLSTGDHRKKYPSAGGFAKTTGKRQLPSDAKQFPIGNSHKQGLQLITKFDDLQYMGGKKT